MDPKSSSTKTGEPDMETGEGNYKATQRYNEGLKRSVEKGDAEKLAGEAKKALEGPEGDELRKAEEQAKRGDTTPTSK